MVFIHQLLEIKYTRYTYVYEYRNEILNKNKPFNREFKCKAKDFTSLCMDFFSVFRYWKGFPEFRTNKPKRDLTKKLKSHTTK